MTYAGFNYISYTLLVIVVSNHVGHADETRAVQLHSQLTSLSLSKELLSSSILLVHLEGRLMIAASERDFPLKTAGNSTFHHIRHPQSYRMALLQASSGAHSMFMDSYSTMYRIQLGVKRVPDHIKSILKLLTQGSPTMIARMLPTVFNNIARIADENEASISKAIDQLTKLGHLFDEIGASLPTQPVPSGYQSSDRTDMILNGRFDSTSAFVTVRTMLQQIKSQIEQLARLIAHLNIKTAFNLTFPVQTACLIPILYTLETNAHFLYQSANLYTHTLNRYVLDQTAGMAKYMVLSTDEERSATTSSLTQQLTSAMHELQQSLIERQNEVQSGEMVLQQAYERLFNEFPYQNCQQANK